MQQLQDFIEHAMQTGGLIMALLVVAFLMLCWMFRPTISRIIEHLFGLPHTNKEEHPNSSDTAHKSDAGHITVNVTNVSIHNPKNVQINHGDFGIGKIPRNDAGNQQINEKSISPTVNFSNLKKHRKFLLGCLGAVLLVWWFSGTQPDTKQKSVAEQQVEQKKAEDIPSESAPPKLESSTVTHSHGPMAKENTLQTSPAASTQAPAAQAITRKQLRGRGRSDGGREEPQYVGVVGYAAVGYNDLHFAGGPYDTPWHIKTYERDKQFWNETDESLEHKTEIVVRKQMLEHKGYDNYDGYLEVERLSDGRIFYIDVGNFITTPYWTYGDVMSAVKIGKCFAVYRQKSDYYPVNIDNKKVDLPDGTWVIVYSTTGTYGQGKPDKKTHQVTGLYWMEDIQRYGGAFFNKDDLQLQY